MSSSPAVLLADLYIFTSKSSSPFFFFVQFGFCDEAWADNPCLDLDYSGYHNSLIQ